MRWQLSHRAARECLPLADRHYNRQKIGSPQFAPPGRAFVLVSSCGRAVWITSWPFAEYVRHAWPGAWINSLFRNEGAGLSSELIREAVAATCAKWQAPVLGMVTFVDPDKDLSTLAGAKALLGHRHETTTDGYRRSRVGVDAEPVMRRISGKRPTFREDHKSGVARKSLKSGGE